MGEMDIGQLMEEFEREVHPMTLECIDEDSLLQFYRTKCYEIWIPLEYVKNNGGGIVFIEDRDIVKKLDKVKKKIKTGLLELLSFQPHEIQMWVDSIYNFEIEIPFSGEAKSVERNRTQAKLIEPLDGRILDITGLWHLYDVVPELKPTVFDLLSHYNPNRIKLIEADNY